MADPTLTNIQILRSPVPHKRPDPTLMLDGQLAVNYKAVDPGLFTKTVEGTLIKFGPVSITNSGFHPNHPVLQAPDGLAGNSHGETWLDGRASYETPVLKVWDQDKGLWINANGFIIDDANGNFTLNKWLTVDRLYANYVQIDGGLDLNGDLTTGGTNCVHNIGTESNRWAGIYGCLLNISGNALIGGDSDISGLLHVGNTLTVDSDADILGTVTLGTTPASGDTFNVNSPSTFASTVDIVGDVTGDSLELAGNLIAKGNVTLGDGCGVTTMDVYSETTFHCDVTFAASPVTFDHIEVGTLLDVKGNTILGDSCAADTLTVNSVSTFNCTTEHEGELRVGRVSGSALNAFGPTTLDGLLTVNNNVTTTGTVTIGQKGFSALTLDTDPDNTLTTKAWVQSWLERGQFWTESGVTLRTTSPNYSIVPNSGTGTLGIPTDRWSEAYIRVVHTGDLHMQNERGDWTLIEEEDCLTMTNNKTGKRYAISMTPYEG